MKAYDTFRKNLYKQMTKTKKEENLSFLHCRDVWGVKFDYMKKGLGDIAALTYFRFCQDKECCPVQTMIVLLKNYIDPHLLITFIRKTFEIEHEN